MHDENKFLLNASFRLLIIIKTNVLLPMAYVNLADVGYPV